MPQTAFEFAITKNLYSVIAVVRARRDGGHSRRPWSRRRDFDKFIPQCASSKALWRLPLLLQMYARSDSETSVAGAAPNGPGHFPQTSTFQALAQTSRPSPQTFSSGL